MATNNLADLYRQNREYSKAEAMFIEVADISRRVLGKEHPNHLAGQSNLGSSFDHGDNIEFTAKKLGGY